MFGTGAESRSAGVGNSTIFSWMGRMVQGKGYCTQGLGEGAEISESSMVLSNMYNKRDFWPGDVELWISHFFIS